MRAHVGFSAVLLIATAVAGCGAGRDRQVTSPQQPRTHAVRLLVTNYHRSTVRVFAVRGTLRHRLGLVTTNRRETFALPAYLYETGGLLQLQVVPLGSRESFLSELIHVRQGVVVEWRVGELLHQSMVFIR